MQTAYPIGCLLSSLFVKVIKIGCCPVNDLAAMSVIQSFCYILPNSVQLRKDKGLFRIPLFPHLQSFLATVSFLSLSVYLGSVWTVANFTWENI